MISKFFKKQIALDYYKIQLNNNKTSNKEDIFSSLPIISKGIQTRVKNVPLFSFYNKNVNIHSWIYTFQKVLL